MVLAPIPWAGRVWALRFLTALVPPERACRERGRRHKPLLDVGRQLVNAECIVLRSAEAKVPTPVGQAALGSGS